MKRLPRLHAYMVNLSLLDVGDAAPR